MTGRRRGRSRGRALRLAVAGTVTFVLRPAGTCPDGFERGLGLAGDACYHDKGAAGIETVPRSDPSRVPEIALLSVGGVVAGVGVALLLADGPAGDGTTAILAPMQSGALVAVGAGF